MSDLDKASTLLDAAERDLRALQGMSDITIFADEIAGFHAQQAAEKLLKDWLALLGEPYPLTHDIDYLLRLVEKRDLGVARFEELIEYNPYAVQFRYESSDADATPLNREEAVQRLEALWQQVRQRLAAAEGA